MAESTVAVTAGSGTLLHSNTQSVGGNTVHDEIVVQGEQYLARYNAGQAEAPLMSTANSHLGQLMAGATLKVRVRRIRVFQYAAATTAAFVDLIVVRLSTAGTGGPADVPKRLDPASPGPPGATMMSLPTVKGTEGDILDRDAPMLIQTIPTAGTPRILLADFVYNQSPIVINAGTSNGIAVKNVTAHAGAKCVVVFTFDEATF